MTAGRNAVVLTTDAKLFPAAVVAATRLAELNNRADTDVLVFCDSPADLEYASAASLPFLVLPLRFPPALKLRTTYYRLFAPVALGATHRRILYLDVDTYIDSPALFRLFDIDLAGHVLAAVRDPIVSYLPDSIELSSVFAAGQGRYLNAGVLLIDTHAYAERGMLGRLVDLVSEKKRRLYRDQTLLNTVLQGNWLELSPAINQFLRMWETWVRDAYPPVVVHFAGHRKAWHGPARVAGHPAAVAMQRQLEGSPWRSFLDDQQRSYQEKPEDRLSPVEYEHQLRLRHEMLAYYRDTEFADVRYGITVPDPGRIPAA